MNPTARRSILVPAILALALLLPQLTTAQERWQFPDKAQNLQQLPADFSGQQLRAVMTGFTRALGVRCSHCHVGEEGQPLSTYDFASDDKPAKQTARKMLGILGLVNQQLRDVQPSGEPVNMWCHTCHHGLPRPQTLGEALTETYDNDGIDAAVTRYGELRTRYFGRGAFDFSENSLNALGYQLISSGDAAAAVKVFLLNVDQFPDSGNAWDSLGAGYAAAGDVPHAIEAYEKSLELDPRNANATRRLEELRAQQQ